MAPRPLWVRPYMTVFYRNWITRKSGARALSFAERGLAKAKETNNRDLEGHCQELIGAAIARGCLKEQEI